MSTSRRRIYAVLVATLVVTATLSVGAVGTIAASGATDDLNFGQSGNQPGDGADVDVEFKGCSEVWIVLESADQTPLDVTIEVYNADTGQVETVTKTITSGDTQTIPGQYGDRPLYKFNVHQHFDSDDGDDKILGVTVEGGDFIENHHRCADNVGDGDDDSDDDDGDDDDGDDDDSDDDDGDDEDGDDDSDDDEDGDDDSDDDEDGDDDSDDDDDGDDDDDDSGPPWSWGDDGDDDDDDSGPPWSH